MSIQKSIKSVLVMLTLVSLISCGSSKPMVDGINVSTEVVDSDIILSLSAELSIGDLQLPSASFPIVLPKIGKEIGMVSLASSGGQNLLAIEINVSDAANLELASVRLPNGSLIPLIADNDVLSIPLGSATVYLSVVPGAGAIGIAIPVKTFDAVGAKVGTTSLMPMFNKDGVVGAAGVFTSKTKGQNGFALVADISDKLDGLLPKSADAIQMEQAPLDYRGQMPSRRIERKINRELLKLHRRRTKLRLR